MKADFFKDTSRHQCCPDAVLYNLRRLKCLVANMRNAHQEIAHILLSPVVLRRNTDTGEIVTKTADVFIDGHFIVIENDDELFA